MSVEILIVDDEPDIRSLIALTLEDEGFQTVQASNAEEARNFIASRPPTCIILDIWMRDSDMDGLETLKWCQSVYPEVPVLMISGHGTIETAVQAIRLGAYDFIEKPFKAERLILTVRKALHHQKIERENAELRARTKQVEISSLTGQSSAVRQLSTAISKVAPTSSRVLILGPSGSGKETVARLVHQQSAQSDGAFVLAPCAQMPASEADLQLFGSESLSGSRRVIGLLEQAHQGTLYLHEICNLPLETQAKLVRAVTEQRFKRVGGVVDVAVDVRIISASRCDLSQAIADKTLLEDLYYRLSVVTLIVPSLRERREDIAPLVKYFAQLSAEQFGKPVPKFGDDLLNAMRAYDWPGSVLQLRNIVESMVILNDGSKDNILGVDDLPADVTSTHSDDANNVLEQGLSMALRDARELFEKYYMTAQLGRFDGNISQMAKFVGMERSALHRKLKTLDIVGEQE